MEGVAVDLSLRACLYFDATKTLVVLAMWSMCDSDCSGYVLAAIKASVDGPSHVDLGEGFEPRIMTEVRQPSIQQGVTSKVGMVQELRVR